MKHFAIVSAAGAILGTGACEDGDLALQRPPEGGTLLEVTQAEVAALRSAPKAWRVVGGALEAATPPEPPIESQRAAALARVDAAAEKTRLRFVTGGAGQALEYQASEAQARAYLDEIEAGHTPDVAAYPFVAAEAAAIGDASGTPPDPQQVAQDIVALANSWSAVGSYIKRLRRRAKLLVEAATTAAEIRAAEQVDWPQP